MLWNRNKLFCDINPTCYKISRQVGIWRRRLRDLFSKEKFAKTRQEVLLPVCVTSHSSGLIKRGKDIDPVLQENKAVNIDLACRKLDKLLIRPGETFSFWRTVGKTSKRKGYLDGRVIEHNRLVPGTGGGLCNLGNTVHLLMLHSPLTVTEVYYHSDALAPDGEKRVPFSSGTSVCYNYIDLRVRNDTDQVFQLHLWCADERLHGELRSEQPIPWRYELVEEGHHFRREGDKYFRISKIYRDVIEKDTGKTVERKLIRANRSQVMFDPALLPPDQIRDE